MGSDSNFICSVNIAHTVMRENREHRTRRTILRSIGFGIPGTTIAGQSMSDGRQDRTATDRSLQEYQPSDPYQGGVRTVAATDSDAFFVIELGATESYYDYNYVGPLVIETNGQIEHVSSLTDRNRLEETLLEASFIAGSTVTGIPIGALFNIARWLAENDPEGDHGLELHVAPGRDPFRLLVWVTGPNPAENVRAHYEVQEVTGETTQRIPFFQPITDGTPAPSLETPAASIEEATICSEIENEWHRSGHGGHSHSHECLDSRTTFSIADEPTVYLWVRMRSVPPATVHWRLEGPNGGTLDAWSDEISAPAEGSVYPERTFWGWFEFSSSAAPGTYTFSFNFDDMLVAEREFTLE